MTEGFQNIINDRSSLFVIVATLILATAITTITMPWFSKKRDYKGRHVFISGGSTGIGLALAKEFMLLGASATVVARTQSKLDKAVDELQDLARARNLPGRAQGLSADVTDNTEVYPREEGDIFKSWGRRILEGREGSRS